MKKQFDAGRYIKEVYRQYIFRIDRRKYPEIIRQMEAQPNISEYLRTLINKDMQKYGEQAKHV